MASLIASSPASLPPISPPLPSTVNTELLLILAALFFFLVCVFTGVALAVRHAWFNRSDPPPPPPLKRKNLDSLPIVSIRPGLKQLSDECPICLAAFAHGDKVRVLPQCSHVFHASCVDTWLVSRSSCPTCRCVIMVVVPSSGSSSVVKEDNNGNSCFGQYCFSNCLLPV
jgi:Ring finger domain